MALKVTGGELVLAPAQPRAIVLWLSHLFKLDSPCCVVARRPSLFERDSSPLVPRKIAEGSIILALACWVAGSIKRAWLSDWRRSLTTARCSAEVSVLDLISTVLLLLLVCCCSSCLCFLISYSWREASMSCLAPPATAPARMKLWCVVSVWSEEAVK